MDTNDDDNVETTHGSRTSFSYDREYWLRAAMAHLYKLVPCQQPISIGHIPNLRGSEEPRGYSGLGKRLVMNSNNNYNTSNWPTKGNTFGE